MLWYFSRLLPQEEKTEEGRWGGGEEEGRAGVGREVEKRRGEEERSVSVEWFCFLGSAVGDSSTVGSK